MVSEDTQTGRSPDHVVVAAAAGRIRPLVAGRRPTDTATPGATLRSRRHRPANRTSENTWYRTGGFLKLSR